MRLTLYARAGCGLCEEAYEVVQAVLGGAVPLANVLEVVDITTDSKLMAAWKYDIPVLTIDGTPAFKHRVDPERLVARLILGTPAPMEEQR